MIMATSRVLHRSLRETPPKAIGGEGIWLIREDGRKVLDASGGAAVSCLGHGHPPVRAALHAQLDKLADAHTSFSPAKRRNRRAAGGLQPGAS